MGNRSLIAIALLVGACAARHDEGANPPDSRETPNEDDAPQPASDDPAPVVKSHRASCRPEDPFREAVPVAGLEAVDGTARFSDDELRGVMSTRLPEGQVELFEATRESLAAPFGTPHAITGLATEGDNLVPALGDDGSTLWFASMHWVEDRARVDIFRATRIASLATGAFGAAREVTAMNAFTENTTPFVAHHASEVWFAAGPDAEAYEIFKSVVRDGTPGKPVPVVELNTGDAEVAPVLSNDGRTVYFTSNRSGEHDIWVATRDDTASRFGPPRSVSEVNTAEMEYPSWLSPDQCRLYIVRGSGSPTKLLVAEKTAR